MFSLKSIFATVSLMALAVAQTPNIAFTSTPAVVVAGQQYNITWGGGDGTGVTITLRRGDPNDLSTVGILGDRITQNYYLWTVDTSLPTASDYALQITQGQSSINYSGLFSLVGGTGSSSLSYSGYSTVSAANATTSHSATMTGGSAASMGTGTTMSRNTTFSSVTLTSTHSSSTATMSSTRTGSTTTQATSAPTSNAASNMGSSAAFVMGLFGAVMFLQ